MAEHIVMVQVAKNGVCSDFYGQHQSKLAPETRRFAKGDQGHEKGAEPGQGTAAAIGHPECKGGERQRDEVEKNGAIHAP